MLSVKALGQPWPYLAPFQVSLIRQIIGLVKAADIFFQKYKILSCKSLIFRKILKQLNTELLSTHRPHLLCQKFYNVYSKTATSCTLFNFFNPQCH